MMLDFHQKRKLKMIINSPIVLGIFFVLIVGMAWSAFTRYQIAVEMSERQEREEATAAALRARKQELEEKVRYLSDERGIEAEMRRQFDVALEGEQVIVIVDPDEGTPIITSTPEVESEPAWYQFWR